MLRMKKVFAILLTVMMLVSVGCVSAEDAIEESSGIMFQGIPWGSSVEDVAQWLLQRDDYSWDSPTVEHLLGFLPLSTGFSTTNMLHTDGTTFDYDEVNKYSIVLASWQTDGSMIPNFQIAGYKISWIDYDFSYRKSQRLFPQAYHLVFLIH